MSPLDGQSDQPPQHVTPTRRVLASRTGMVLIVISSLLWLVLLVVPLLSLNVTQKVGLGTGLFVGVQITWWVGLALAGPDVVQRIRCIIPRFTRKRGS